MVRIQKNSRKRWQTQYYICLKAMEKKSKKIDCGILGEPKICDECGYYSYPETGDPDYECVD